MKSPLAATTFSSLDRKWLQALLGGLPGDVAEDLHDGGDQGLFFLWEDLLIPLLDTPHFK